MKKQISLLLTFFAMAIIVHAQAPNAIPYQGVARNSSGSILASQAIRLRLTIRDVTAGGTIVYQETQAVNTSTLGLFNVNIGQGTIVTGTLAGVNWGGGAKFLQVEMDPTGGTNYISMGTTQLNSVPYALFAGSISGGAGWSLTGNASTSDTSFIGTTNNNSFNIRVNNQLSGRIDPILFNTFYGQYSGVNTTGTYNTGSGIRALQFNTSGNFNMANGANTLRFNTTGSYNVANGAYTLYQNTTGSYNMGNGASTLQNNTIGNNNVATGYAALFSNTSGSYNIGTGANALYSDTSGSYNVATGYAALQLNTNGNYNSANGYYSLRNNITGANNSAYGPYSLYGNNGNNNSAFGNYALRTNTTGSNNTAIGDSADVTTGGLSNATAIGYQANVSASNTIQLGNTAIDSVMAGTSTANTKLVVPRIRVTAGSGIANQVLTSDALGNATWQNASSGWNLSGNAGTVDGNNFMGTTDNVPLNFRVNNQAAGRIDPTLSNTFYGQYTGVNTTGTYNTATGNRALQYNTSGTFNMADGANTLRFNTTGSYNVANGAYTLYQNTTGSFNMGNGASALQNNTIGNNNVATGYAALFSNTSGSYNIATGAYALYSDTSGSNNIATGYAALQLNTAGNNNSANGYYSLRNNTIGANNSAYGANALYANNGNNNSAFGNYALRTNTTGSNNTAIGDSADVTTGALTNATAIGYNAKVSANNTIQLGNTAIDSVMAGTLSANTKLVVPRLKITGGTIGANNILTSDALGNATWQPAAPSGWSLSGNAGTVDGTNFIGTSDNIPFNIRMNNQKAGRIDSSLRTTFYGYQSGGSTTTGGYNTANGYKSLFSNTTGAYNTGHGYKSLYSNTTGANNTANGDSALYSNTTGGFNTAHGYAALASNTTGSNNTAIGDSADVTTGALTNATAIGYNAKVSVSNTIQLGNAATDSVMAGSAADSTKLIIPRLRVTGGTPAVGKVLTATDVNGNAKWQTLPSGFPTATAPGQMVYWNGSAWVIVPAGTRGQTLTYCEGVPTWGACPAIYATVTTTVITGITNVSASGGGNVTYNGDANVTARGIVWGTDTLPSIATHLGITTDGSGNGAFISSLTGLLASTKYHVRAYATNSVGTSYGVDTSFTTAAAAVPTVATVAPSAVGSTTANPGGNISSNGGATVSQSGIVYSTSNVAPTGPLAGLNPGTYSYTTDGNTTSWTSSLTGLTLGTPYYTYAYANNIAGTGYGTVQSFTTINIPTVTTTTVSSITATSASGGGNVTADGGATVTERGVCWGTSANPTTAGTHAAAGVAGTGSFILNLTSLSGATVYHYRAYATNSAGTSYGTDLTFTTTISQGDTYQGGKVFYLLQPGDPGYDANVQHGLIAATADTSASATWWNGSYTSTTATATALGSGSTNTDAIISSQSAGTYAASLCKAYTAGGLTSNNVWYLPSKDELLILYTNQAYAGGFGFGSYWSSSEDIGDNTKAWIYSFAGGNPFSVLKSGTASVRPIRSF